MQAVKVLRTIIQKRKLSLQSASVKCGRSPSYFSAMFGQKSVPKVDTMSDLLDKLGFDLIARDRRGDRQEIKITAPTNK